MADITEFVHKRFALSEFTLTLKDETLASDLTDFDEIRFVARKQGRDERVIDGVPVTIVQTSSATDHPTRGKIKYKFDATTAAIPTGTFDVEFHGYKDGNLDTIWPSNRKNPFGKLICQESA